MLEDFKQKNYEYIETIKELELQINNCKIDLDGIRNANSKEYKSRSELEINNLELEKIIKDKEHQLKSYFDELNYQRFTNDKLVEDNEKLFNELEMVKNHILILTEQNSKLTEELDLISEQDDRMKAHLNRRDRIMNIKKSNIYYIEKSLNHK